MEGDFLGKEAKGTYKNMFLLSEQNHIYIKNTKRLNLSVEPYEIENETDFYLSRMNISYLPTLCKMLIDLTY